MEQAEVISVKSLTDNRLQAAVDSKDYPKVVKYLLAYLSDNPYNLTALQQVGNAYYQQKEYDNAITYYQRYAELDKNETIMFQIGKCYVDKNEPSKAIPYLLAAVNLNPESNAARTNLGLACYNAHEFDTSIEHLTYLFDKGVKNYSILFGLGASYLEKGDLKKSEYFFRWLCEINDENPINHTNLAIALLLQEKFEEGWYQYRWLDQLETMKRNFPIPKWRGEKIPGKTLLLCTDQGVGDSMQMVRFVPLLEKKDTTIFLECYDSIYRLCTQIKGIDKFIQRGEKIPKVDYYCPLSDLPGILGIKYDNIPFADSYFHVTEEEIKAKKDLFQKAKGLKVGIVWAGNPKHAHDFKRTIPFKLWEPLLKVKDIQFYSLQKGQACAQLTEFKHQVIDLAEHLGDFYETAVCMMHLDLIITVDTSVAHLAGALGIPVWTLISFVPDWRWTMAGETTPWYESMRLYRQAQPGDWVKVLEKVAKDIKTIGSDSKKKKPTRKKRA